MNWPLPQNLKQLRGCLGLSGYYRKFVKGYANIVWPLAEMLKQDSFHWNPDSELSSHQLKQTLTSTPTLALLDFTMVETDISTQGIRAILSQEAHLLAFFSKKLSPHMTKALTHACA